MTSWHALQLAAVLSAAASSPWAQDLEVKSMAVEGANLAYVEAGSGTPVVFIHGALSDRRVWDGYAALIAPERRFVAYSQRYFGNEDWPDDGKVLDTQVHVDDLIAFVEGLGGKPVHMVTWSYAGEIGTHAAYKRPDLFASMVHYEPSTYFLYSDLPGAASADRQALPALVAPMAAMEAGRLDDASLGFIEAVFQMPSGTAKGEPDPWPTIWRENSRTLPLFVERKQLPRLSCEELHTVDVPTLIVQGANAYVQDAMVAERLAECMGNALVVTMPDANHDGPYRQPAEFTARIQSFFELVD